MKRVLSFAPVTLSRTMAFALRIDHNLSLHIEGFGTK
jgi:hypothetical protein